MKKIICLFFAIICFTLVLCPLIALAEPVAQPQEPYTWEYLATMAGATAATLLIVQFLKAPLDRIWKIPTRLFVYVVALVILLIATTFTTGLTAENTILSIVNAFLVALTAYGTYELTFAKTDKSE